MTLQKLPDTLFEKIIQSGKKQSKMEKVENISVKCYKQQQSPDVKKNDFVGELSYIVGKPKLT